MKQSELNKRIIHLLKEYNVENDCVVDGISLDVHTLEKPSGKIEATSYTCKTTTINNRV